MSLFLRIHVVAVPEMLQAETSPGSTGEVEIQVPFEPLQTAIYLWRSIWSSGPQIPGTTPLSLS